MAYIYAIWISTNAQEDVNKEFRKNGLKGEVECQDALVATDEECVQ